ncbi:MAG: class I mannose-6-phosphate isomerase [Planctomycetes bacterium]|nr:class I mannose-6-phosphate isomerase [Planctomycetota bacterium]MBL6997022.1 class I mannose-6-phosphate isomerase [Phycisphaerales bacterium]
MEPYPLTFEPLLKEKVWGGRTLERFGKQVPDAVSIGESWELADLPASIPDGKSIISNGSLSGRTLDEGFPLLIKFLDANDNLSVQVHPSEAYAAKHPEAHLKSEAWIILDTTTNGCIYVGLKAGTTEGDLRNAIANDTVPELLNAINVKKGECYYLPSGTCHALGAGVLVAEVQTPSDTTFRVWDWGRLGREMHVEQAMECIEFNSKPLTFSQTEPLASGDFLTTHFVDTPFFSIERIESTSDTTLDLIVDETPVVLMVVEGNANIEHAVPVAAPVGTTILLPVGLTNATMVMPKGTAILRFDLPDKNRIA